MTTLLLFLLGLVLWLVGCILFLKAAFHVGFWWLLGCIFIPPVQLLFLIFYWGKAWKPFLVVVTGISLMVLSAFLLGSGVGDELYEQWQELRAQYTRQEVQGLPMQTPTEIPAGFTACRDAEGRVTYTNLPCDAAP